MTEVGMPATEAIKSATITAAKVLEIGNRLGSIEPDKTADVIAVPVIRWWIILRLNRFHLS